MKEVPGDLRLPATSVVNMMDQLFPGSSLKAIVPWLKSKNPHPKKIPKIKIPAASCGCLRLNHKSALITQEYAFALLQPTSHRITNTPQVIAITRY